MTLPFFRFSQSRVLLAALLWLAWLGCAQADPLRTLETDPGTKVPITIKAFLAPAAVRAASVSW